MRTARIKNRFFFPKGILTTPNPIEDLSFKNIKDKKILEINDEHIRIKKDKDLTDLWFILYGGTCFAFGLPFLLSLNMIDSSETKIVFGAIFFIPLLWVVYRHYRTIIDKYPFECELNRIDNTITYSRPTYKQRLINVSFFDCKLEWSSVAHGRFSGSNSLIIRDSSDHIIDCFMSLNEHLSKESADDIFNLSSFFCWYMDKNRPLPEGSLLDQYRNRDFVRRQKDGFPHPLVPSLLEMCDINGNVYKKSNESDLELIDE